MNTIKSAHNQSLQSTLKRLPLFWRVLSSR
jgi:hypothetical protein